MRNGDNFNLSIDRKLFLEMIFYHDLWFTFGPYVIVMEIHYCISREEFILKQGF